MFKIDQNRIAQILADFPGDPKDKVNSLAKNEKELFDAYKLKIWNIIEHMNEQTVYALSKWIIAQDRLLINTYQKKTTPFARGDIVKVELGATNFYIEELQSELKGMKHRHDRQTTVLDMSLGVINHILERHPELEEELPFDRSVLERDGA